MLKYLRELGQQTWPYLLIIVIGTVTAALVPHPQQSDTESAYKTEDQQYPLETWATILAAIFTGMIAGYAVMQYDESRLSNKRDLRAYISAIPARAALMPDDVTMVIEIPLRNCGKTPAFDFYSFGDINVMPIPVPIENDADHLNFFLDPREKGHRPPTFVIFPESQHASIVTHAFTWNELIRVSSGWGVYVFGRCFYTDAFGDEQWTEHCGYIESRDFLDWTNRALEAYEEGARKMVPVRIKFTAHNNRASFI